MKELKSGFQFELLPFKNNFYLWYHELENCGIKVLNTSTPLTLVIAI